jgi:copper transport protein
MKVALNRRLSFFMELSPLNKRLVNGSLLMFVMALLFCAFSQPVFAHAYLKNAEPLQASTLQQSPTEIRLTFSEKVNPKFSKIVVHGEDDKKWTGALRADADSVLVLSLPELANGEYKVEWRMLSVDSHIATGQYSFNVLRKEVRKTPQTQQEPSLQQEKQVQHDHTTPNTTINHRTWQSTLHQLLRVVDGLAITVLFSYFFMYWLFIKGSTEQNRLREWYNPVNETRLYIILLCIAIVSGTVHIWHLANQLQSANHMWPLLSDTLLGQTILFKCCAIMLLILLARLQTMSKASGLIFRIGIGLGLIALFPLTGHAFASEKFTLTVLFFHWVHMLTAITWTAGLIGLTIFSVRLEQTTANISRLQTLIEKFSAWAFPLLFISTLTGIANAINKFQTWSQIGSTVYGNFLIFKLVLVLLILLLAILRRFGSSSENRIVLMIRLELLLAFMVLVTAGLLAVTPLPS